METKTRKIIKLLAIIVAWVLCSIVPPMITIESPIKIAIKAIILVIPMWIFGRDSSNRLLRMVWGFCDGSMSKIGAGGVEDAIFGILGFVLGLFALGAISAIWSICIFFITLYQLIADAVNEAADRNAEEENIATAAEESSLKNDKEDEKQCDGALTDNKVIYID